MHIFSLQGQDGCTTYRLRTLLMDLDVWNLHVSRSACHYCTNPILNTWAGTMYRVHAHVSGIGLSECHDSSEKEHRRRDFVFFSRAPALDKPGASFHVVYTNTNFFTNRIGSE
jgi:hypothetical protein